jgi:multisubunit Na+/H+ antiporter MnhB subunit
MEQRKQRIANAKKNARLAGRLRRRRQLQALGGLLAVAAVLTLAYLWQSGSWFFGDEPAPEETPGTEVTETAPLDPSATIDPSATPTTGESSELPTETTSETTE